MRFTRETLLVILLVVAALGLGSVVTSRLPQPEDVMDQPFVHETGRGGTVHLRSMSYTLTGVDAAPRVATGPREDDVRPTPGIWLVVSLEATAHGEPTTVPGPYSRVEAADGRQFNGLSGLLWGCGMLQPGFTMNCQVVFEVAPDALAGAKLHIPASAYLDVPDDVAVLDLGITPEQQAAWVGSERVIELTASTPKGR